MVLKKRNSESFSVAADGSERVVTEGKEHSVTDCELENPLAPLWLSSALLIVDLLLM